jgi:hypothetical protein
MSNHRIDHRQTLDLLFLFDSAASFVLGVIALLTPHGLLQKIVGGGERIVIFVRCF